MTTEVATPAEGLTLPEIIARAAAQKAMLDRFTELHAAERTSVFASMMQVRALTSSKSFDAKIDGETVASFTITEPQDKIIVSDPEAFTDWVMDNYPSEVETVVRVRPAFEKVLLARARAAGDDDEFAVDPDTGVVVDGLKVKPAGEPTSFAMKFKPEGREKAIAAALENPVSELLGIEAGGDQ